MLLIYLTLWSSATWLENPRTEWRFLARKSLMVHFPARHVWLPEGRRDKSWETVPSKLPKFELFLGVLRVCWWLISYRQPLSSVSLVCSTSKSFMHYSPYPDVKCPHVIFRKVLEPGSSHWSQMVGKNWFFKTRIYNPITSIDGWLVRSSYSRMVLQHQTKHGFIIYYGLW